MYLDFTPEQKELRAYIRASLETVMTPERTAALAGGTEGANNGEAAKECVRALGDAHLLGRGEGPSTAEHGQAAQQKLLLRREMGKEFVKVWRRPFLRQQSRSSDDDTGAVLILWYLLAGRLDVLQTPARFGAVYRVAFRPFQDLRSATRNAGRITITPR